MVVHSYVSLEESQIQAMHELVKVCREKEPLQGEIPFDKSVNAYPEMHSWFLLYENQTLQGVLSAFAPGTVEVEISGYIHPDRRRQGYFAKLIKAVTEEVRKYRYQSFLFVCERSSQSGQQFMNALGAAFAYTEYMMMYQEVLPGRQAVARQEIDLQKASSDDLEPLMQLGQLVFSDTPEEARQHFEATLSSPYRVQYLARVAQEPVGIVAVAHENQNAYIIGLGVHPRQRGKGYGKAILLKLIHQLRQTNVNTICIEVDSGNEVAVQLYLQAGFLIKIAYDYFLYPVVAGRV